MHRAPSPIDLLDGLDEEEPGEIQPIVAPWMRPREATAFEADSGRAHKQSGHANMQVQAIPAAAAPSTRVDLKWQIRVQLRRIFVLIDEFHVLVKFESQRGRLQLLTQDLVVAAKGCFAVAELLRAERDPANSDHECCVADLEAFGQSLASGQTGTTLELTHALDCLLVNCLLLDVEHREVLV